MQNTTLEDVLPLTCGEERSVAWSYRTECETVFVPSYFLFCKTDQKNEGQESGVEGRASLKHYGSLMHYGYFYLYREEKEMGRLTVIRERQDCLSFLEMLTCKRNGGFGPYSHQGLEVTCGPM